MSSSRSNAYYSHVYWLHTRVLKPQTEDVTRSDPLYLVSGSSNLDLSPTEVEEPRGVNYQKSLAQQQTEDDSFANVYEMDQT